VTASVSRRLVTTTLVALLVLTLVPTSSARAAPMYGHDISWPQCPTSAGGFGLPMPPTSTAFVIVGVNGPNPSASPRQGLPFFPNPCLASQVQWVKERGKPAHAYTIPAFPTASQLTTYRAAGPWSTRTRAGQLSNVGYAEARYALDTMRAAGFAPPVVWIDVEPRTTQPWPSATARQRRENRYVVEGMMRALRDAGKAYGLYSYTNGWNEITGGWRLPGVPVWATAGTLDYPNEALDRCTQPSFSRGKVLLSQWYDSTRDYDLTCEPYAFTPFPIPPSSLSNSTNEFDGDWNNDVLARRRSTGELWLYPGNGRGGWRTPVRIGTGWGARDLIDTVGDLNADGATDVVARDPSTGYLWFYAGDGRGGWLPRARIGTQWQRMTAIVGPGDWNGDQRADLLARDGATGELWLYPGTAEPGWPWNGTIGFAPRVRVGTGWNVMNAIVGAGDVNGDGNADLWARERSTGDLWLYPGNGRGGLLPRVKVGRGWNVMDALVGVGDFDGDRVVDLLARERSTGRLWLYPGDGAGGWRPRVQVGTGWNVMDALM
jgi:hypothetical protein